MPIPDVVIEEGLIGPATVVVQLNVVVPIFAVGIKLSASPLQVVCASVVEVFVTTGTGFTVTVTGKVGPAQPFAHGVMAYVTEPFETPSLLDNVCAMVFPAPALAPFTFVATAVQVKVVPVTPLGLVITIEVVDPEHIVAGEALANATGRTVTT